MSYDSSNYDPLDIVRSTHAILHLNPQTWGAVSNDFNITYNDYYNDYTKSLITVPAVCAILGVLAIVVLQIALCARRICCECCRCFPTIIETESQHLTDMVISAAKLPRFRLLTGLFIACAVLTFLVDQSIILGQVNLINGVRDTRDTVNYLYNVFEELNNYGNELYSYGDALSNEFAAASQNCPAVQNYQQQIDTYNSYVDDYMSYVTPVPGHLSDVKGNITSWGIVYLGWALWTLYGLILVGLFLYGCGYFFKSKCMMRVSIAFTEIILIVLFLLAGSLMVLLIVYADFCMAPVTYTPQIVPNDIYNLTVYYTTCNGVNPMEPIINQAESFTNQYYNSVELLYTTGPQCQGNPYLEDALNTLTVVNQTLYNITAEIYCPPTQQELVNFLERDFCRATFNGLYTVWMGQYFCAGLLLLTTIFVSLTYQYFGYYWEVEVEIGTTGLTEPVQSNHPPPEEDVHYILFGEDAPRGSSVASSDRNSIPVANYVAGPGVVSAPPSAPDRSHSADYGIGLVSPYYQAPTSNAIHSSAPPRNTIA